MGDACAAAGSGAGLGPGRYSHNGKTEFKTTRMITIPTAPAMKYRYQFTPVAFPSRRQTGALSGMDGYAYGWTSAGVGDAATRTGAWTACATGAPGSTVIDCQLGNNDSWCAIGCHWVPSQTHLPSGDRIGPLCG